MEADKDAMLRLIEAQALAEAEYLAGEFVRAAQADREAVLSALETERWLAGACRECRLGL